MSKERDGKRRAEKGPTTPPAVKGAGADPLDSLLHRIANDPEAGCRAEWARGLLAGDPEERSPSDQSRPGP